MGSRESASRARNLRKDSTSAETKLWFRLRGRRLYGLKFRRQHPLQQYLVDFCCIHGKLIVEVDGDSHARRPGFDRDRDSHLESLGYRVLRFTNDEVSVQLEAVLDRIARACGVSPEAEDHAGTR